MYYDQHGRPDPNGQFQKRDGKLMMRPGAYLSFDVFAADAAPIHSGTFLTDAPVTLNDAERAFADSAEGREVIAYAKSKHALNGPRAGVWDQGKVREAIAAAMAQSQAAHNFGTSINDAATAERAERARGIRCIVAAGTSSAWRQDTGRGI